MNDFTEFAPPALFAGGRGLVVDLYRETKGKPLGAGAIMPTDKGQRLNGISCGAAIRSVGSIDIACGLGSLTVAEFILALTFCVPMYLIGPISAATDEVSNAR
ncbi:hypothetical protein [Roseovarius sp. Pro17]|uniref:hypothetical protein n=1 Tax=Roseovarius sp. Pro17 TaxID=3108175 RepID=UPI002D77287B|nr:hypothetical protein [Roseovarius sp. Pro17]